MSLILSRPFNLIAFNLVWLASVIGRDQVVWLLTPVVFIYSGLLVLSGTVRLYQIALPALVGICIDACLTLAGVFQFNHPSLILPLWLISLWIAFATTLTQSLEIVGRNKAIACVLGAIFVPLNYVVGARLGAVSFGHDIFFTFTVLSVVWALLLPLLFYLAGESRRSADVVS